MQRHISTETAELIVVNTPDGDHKFYKEPVPLTSNGSPDKKVVTQLFKKYEMTIPGPPLSQD